MFNIMQIVPKEEFEYWFKRISPTTLQVYKQLDDTFEITDDVFNEAAVDSEVDRLGPTVADCYYKFAQSRPEYVVGLNSTQILDYYLKLDSTFSLADVYDVALAGAMLVSGESRISAKVSRCLGWLHPTDFYQAPGSTIYHDSEPSGLLNHSLRVMDRILELIQLPAFQSVNIEEAVIVALTHDWCKIGLYEQYMRNVKNENTGKWESVPAFRRVSAKNPFGHGAASMFIAMKLIPLTNEMALAIRWHMGKWNVVDSEIDELQNSNESYPLVHLLQFADQLAITEYAN